MKNRKRSKKGDGSIFFIKSTKKIEPSPFLLFYFFLKGGAVEYICVCQKGSGYGIKNKDKP
jgi:hypothetical protein